MPADAALLPQMIVDRLNADSVLAAILTGGVYEHGAIQRQGITRKTHPDAFDARGPVKPLAIVKGRNPIPDDRLTDEAEGVTAASLVVELYLHEDVGYSHIEMALPRIYTLLQGWKMASCWPLRWIFSTAPLRDEGSLYGSSLQRVDYRVRFLQSPTP